MAVSGRAGFGPLPLAVRPIDPAGTVPQERGALIPSELSRGIAELREREAVKVRTGRVRMDG